MKKFFALTRAPAVLACLGLLTPACIIVADDDDGDPAGSEDNGGSDEETGGADADESGDAESESGGSDESESGGSGDDSTELQCGEQRLVDPGFEAGTPSEAWTEASEVFGTLLCDTSCTDDEGAGPYAGEWFVWFGGIAEPEQASISQAFTVTGDEAELSFMLAIGVDSGAGDDVFYVQVDDQEVFAVTDADWETYEGYARVTVDLTEFADGAEHTLTLGADLVGDEVTSFFVDDLALIGCSEIAAAEESGDESGGADESGGSDTGGEDTGGEETGGEETTG